MPLLIEYPNIAITQTTISMIAVAPGIAIIDLLLSLPFGCIARFSNGGWKKPIG
jgi:hypothetical protein